MRRIARVDRNQAEIVQALRSMGATVQHLHTIGKGCPDILVGFGGKNYLMEIKDGSKPPSKQLLTPREIAWHQSWQGQVVVVNSESEALHILGEYDVIPRRYTKQ